MIDFHHLKERKLFKSLIICYLFSVVLSLDIRQYGENCSSNIFQLFCDHKNDMFCHHEKCQCSISASLEYKINAQPFCHNYAKAWGFQFNNSRCHSCTDDQFCSNRGFCRCKNNKILVDGKCYNPVYKGPMEKCFIGFGSTAYLCDPNQLTYCNDRGVCACFMEYSYNKSSAKCERRIPSDFVLGEWKYNIGEFCFTHFDCLEGLECLDNNTCACSRFCPPSEDGVCGCFSSGFIGPEGIFWCIFFSPLLCCFCSYFIKKYKKHTAEGPQRSGPSTAGEVSLQAPNISKKDPFFADSKPPSYSEVVSKSPPLPFNAPNSYESSPPPPYTPFPSESPLI